MKRSTLLVIILVAFFGTQRAAVSQAPTLDTVFAKMEKANKDYPYLQGNVEKSIYNDLLEELRLDGSGKIWISNSGSASRRVKVEFDKPEKRSWLLDSGVFIDYYPKTKSGKKLTFNKDRQPEAECVFFGLCESTALLKQYYTLTVAGQPTLNGVNTVLLEMRPKDKKREEYFTLLKLGLDANKWWPVQTQVYTSGKNYSIFKYSGFKTGSISSSTFDLKLPKDAELEPHKF